MMKKGLHLILAIVLFSGLVGIVGCGEQEIASIDLVPQDASFVASIQINEILTDEDIAEAYNEAEKPPEWPQTFDDALGWIEDEAGIDPSDFTDALIFGDIESGDYFGAIVKGTFDREALLESVEQAIGEEMAISTYQGYQIYRMTIEEEAVTICFLSGDTIVVGLTDAVKDVIDVREGAPHLSGPVYDTYNALGDVWVKGALEVPEAAMGDISEWDIPIGLEAFEDIEAAGFGFNKAGENLSLQIKVYFSDAEAAANAEEMIGGLLVLLPLLMLEMPVEIADLLDGLSISRSGSWLTITLETTVAEIEELMELIPTLTPGAETAYNSERESIQTAVLAYYATNYSTWPTSGYTNPATTTPGYPGVIDMTLLTSPATGLPYLYMAPASANVGNHCMIACSGHYLWSVGSDGNVFSECQGTDCTTEADMDGVKDAGEDGWQGVYP